MPSIAGSMWRFLSAGFVVAILHTSIAGAASPKVKLHVAFQPDKLGASATVIAGFNISTSTGAVPPPVTEADISLPAGMGFATSELGLETCTQAVLLLQGPDGCPSDSLIGVGTALAEAAFGKNILSETVSIDAFMGKSQEGHGTIVFYVLGLSPVYAELIFHGALNESPQPFGMRLDTSVPLTPTVPGAPYASVVSMKTEVGPLHITYHKQVHGHDFAYAPKGMMVPRHCPKHGFPVAAQFTFEDGSHTHARSSIPCPDAATRMH